MWVKIAVGCAASHDTAESLGDIEQISINSQSNVNIDLKCGICSYGGEVQAINTMIAPTPIFATMYEAGSVSCRHAKDSGFF